MFYSPLRYPGGKTKLAPFIKKIFQKKNLVGCTYIEPYAGGAGLALTLLIEGYVNKIIINDISSAICSFWDAVINDTERLCKMIYDTAVTMEEWNKQRAIYNEASSSFELAFATFFLNRTNRSGILAGGPIGGKQQAGKWKIDARYNKRKLIKRIEKIALQGDKIEVYNEDCLSLINNVISGQKNQSFIYLDPPYFNKGKCLYENYYDDVDHKILADAIINKIKWPWILTYDYDEVILSLYSGQTIRKYQINYSAAKNTKGTELMIFSDAALCPSNKELEDFKVNINLSEV